MTRSEGMDEVVREREEIAAGRSKVRKARSVLEREAAERELVRVRGLQARLRAEFYAKRNGLR